MNAFRGLLPRLWKHMRARPKTTIAVAIGVLALTLGVWSCQTTTGWRPLSESPSGHVAEPEVRIRVRSGIQSVKLDGPSTFSYKPQGGVERTLAGPVTLTVGTDGIVVMDGHGAVPSPGWSVFELSAVAKTEAAPRIRIDTSLYPSRIRILPRRPMSMAEGDGKMDVVAITGIEDYLVGVVASELYPDWKSHGVFEVQAICARTYALHQRQRSIDARQEWDLESTEEDQAYKGGTFKAEAYKGVHDTRGVVLTWEGKLLRTYYSSTCGGRTAAAADTWPTTQGYEFNLAAPIQAYPREAVCQASPRYRWEVTRDREALSRQLREFGKARSLQVAGLGLLRSVEVEREAKTGRPATYKVYDTTGKGFSMSAEQLRLACNYRPPGSPSTRDALVRSGDVEMEVKGTSVLIRGRGFGHGVGMCQFCAKAMSDRGDTWQQMVARFYPGAKVERAY